VKDCCLLLEAAFFEFCGGVADNHSDEMVSSAMQLFNDPKGRRSVALETKGPKRGGLWNSKESRLIFRELVSSKCQKVYCITSFQSLFLNRLHWLNYTFAVSRSLSV
jgi:hypothetical protein